jgi:hypothetical protein
LILPTGLQPEGNGQAEAITSTEKSRDLIVAKLSAPLAEQRELTSASSNQRWTKTGFITSWMRIVDVTRRGFVTEPLDNHGWEWRCYMRDPDGYPIEVGQY